MQLVPGKSYLFSSAERMFQVIVPTGQEATLNIQAVGSSAAVTKKFTESDVYSAFIGHSKVTVGNASCEITVTPSNAIAEI
ncbi:hypothetical protein [Pseudoalteromonas ulvae]|uniref:Uncharacterized protein n=1 Tax=Pseudoalteromonas ulvae TaxID=107327 RepID=A0A244CUJ4_PSEDV|nr:hypothetical protein [Pseudoalteromonas ulvae]OUL59254.1 hypothetical protein B1199_03015 [Pseudoalteromonas ulvae]